MRRLPRSRRYTPNPLNPRKLLRKPELLRLLLLLLPQLLVEEPNPVVEPFSVPVLAMEERTPHPVSPREETSPLRNPLAFARAWMCFLRAVGGFCTAVA